MTGGASLLVAVQVTEWKDVEMTKVLKNLTAFEAEVKSLAQQNGVDVNRPFPFMLTGKVSYLKSHVINAPGAEEKSHEAFKQSGIVEEMVEAHVTILGFYSEQHQTVFTHHDSFIHAHVLNDQTLHAAHVDDLKLTPGMTLKLPKNW